MAVAIASPAQRDSSGSRVRRTGSAVTPRESEAKVPRAYGPRWEVVSFFAQARWRWRTRVSTLDRSSLCQRHSGCLVFSTHRLSTGSELSLDTSSASRRSAFVWKSPTRRSDVLSSSVG